MISRAVLIGAAGLYLLALFVFAHLIEHKGGATRHPRFQTIVFLLALGAFISGWAYLSGGSGMIEEGMQQPALGLGASLAFMFGWPLIVKAVRIARAHHVTTLPGFLALRFGNSRFVPVVSSLLLLVGMVPYVALQLGGLAFAYRVLSSPAGTITTRSPAGPVLGFTLVLVAFSILFGARRADPTIRHESFVLALAIDAIVKLVAAVAVAVIALWRFPHLFADPSIWPHLPIGSTPENTFPNWTGFMFLGMGGVVLLPHIFHLLVVESPREEDVARTRWGFPIYNIFFFGQLAPIALAGVLIGLKGPMLQGAILLLPGQTGSFALTLLAYVGAVAATMGMAVVTLLALSNIVMSDLLLPFLVRRTTKLGPLLLPLRWLTLFVLARAAFLVWFNSDITFLARFGYISFIAALQLAPAFFLGLLWPGLRARAVAWGIGLGSLIWFYTAFLPTLTLS